MDDSEIESIIYGVITDFLIPRFRELGMPASGEWENTVEARKNEIWGRDYTEYLVQGRPPNANQDPQALKAWVGWAGSTFLSQWVRDKGIAANPFAVAWKIARSGTRYYPEGTDLLEVLNSQEVEEYIVGRYTDLVVRQVTNDFNKIKW